MNKQKKAIFLMKFSKWLLENKGISIVFMGRNNEEMYIIEDEEEAALIDEFLEEN